MVRSEALSQAISVSQKRLTRTLEHVVRHWIPVNRVLLRKIREGLERGSYENDRSELVRDLKSDLSLYTWCLRQLCLNVQREQPDEDFDPIRSLEDIELQELRELLDTDDRAISEHNIDESNKQQVDVLREVMLGASAAGVITEKVDGDSRAYGATVLRQLGLTLIAWNYPTLFQDAMKEVKDGAELDTEISKKLGFSPSLLASKLVREWGVSEKKCLSLGLLMPSLAGEQQSSEQEESEEQASFLTEVCELGEKLARANEAENYPAEADKWEEVESRVKKVLGFGGIATIRERFEENCAHYATFIPAITESKGNVFDRIRYPNRNRREELEKRNKYIEGCSSEVKLAMKRLYGKLSEEDSVSRENLKILIHELIPKSGFSAGCVFTMDPTLAKLVPQLSFGKIQTRKIEAIDCTNKLDDADIVAEAYQRIDPVTKTVTSNSGARILLIAGPVGRLRRLGVLLLECSDDEKRKDSALLTQHLRAVSRALADCLNI